MSASIGQTVKIMGGRTTPISGMTGNITDIVESPEGVTVSVDIQHYVVKNLVYFESEQLNVSNQYCYPV